MKHFLPKKTLAMAVALVASQVALSASLEEVVVTAQKRTESLQDIPIAMNAYDANSIQSMGLNSAKDIGLVAPSLQMPTYPTSSNNLALFIRGVGNADSISLTKDNTVGLYYDGVYAGRSSGLLSDLSDLERVEILRGPQGTLYGRNTTSGAINFINAKPTGELGLKQTFTAGDMGIYRSITNVNLPAVAGIKAKVTAAFSGRDGWVENDGPGKVAGAPYEDYYQEEKEGYRIALRYDGLDDLVIDYAYDYSDMDSTAAYFQYAGPVGGLDAGFQPITNSYASRLEETRTPTGGSRKAYSLPLTKTEVKGHNLTIAYSINDNMEFKSITGLRKLDDNNSTNFSQAFGGAGSLEINTTTDHEQFSQEFQLLGDYEGIKYVAGLYYLEEDATQSESQYLDRALVDTTGIYAFDLPGFTPCSVGGMGVGPACTNLAAVYPAYLGNYTMTSDVESTAVFGQVTWTPSAAALQDRLDITAGLRYTEDERQSQRTSDGWAFNSFGPGATNTDLSKTDWSLVADYSWSDDFSTYVKAATAFRSGGSSRNSLNYNEDFGKETLISYELGWKAELMDKRVRFNGAIFQMQIKDIILDYLFDPVNAPQFVQVFNSGEATIEGLEMDVTAAVTENFTVGFNYAYLDSEFKDAIFPDGVDRTETTVLTWAPEHAYSITADYSMPIKVGVMNFHLDYAWQDDQFALANTNFGEVVVADFGLLNGRVSLGDVEIAGGNWQFALWSKNMLDDDSVNYRIGSTAVTYLQPRTIGADVTFEF